MTLSLYSSPWAYFCKCSGTDLYRLKDEAVQAATAIRLVGELSKHARWNGSRPVLASVGNAKHPAQWDLPFRISPGRRAEVFRNYDREVSINVLGLPIRTQEQDRENDPRERWLLWQIQRFNELASLERTHGMASSFEASYAGGVRRSWERNSQLWQEGGEEQAELSLIVKLARKRKFILALRAIERNPRNMLLRKHRPQKIAHIQEMDATTLRAYSRAPGLTAAQKAGPRQELLAVVREDTADLPENRVLLWTVHRMKRMAQSYCSRNASHAGSERFEIVQRLFKLTNAILSSPRLSEVSPLPHHLSTPTYCLQFESRYRHIWKAYLEIRRQENQLDDSWRWHSHLWGSSSRLILTSLLMELPGWREQRISTPYFRTEGLGGEWTMGPSTPGPFASPLGDCVIVEMRSGAAHQQIQQLGLPTEVFASGAEWIFCWPKAKRICLMWSAIASEASNPLPLSAELQEQLQAQSADSSWGWRGLVLLAEPDSTAEDSDWVDSYSHLTILRIPSRVHKHWEDLQAGLELALEDMNEG